MSLSISPLYWKFHQRVLEEEALFAQLQAAPNAETMAALAVQLGAERGLAFTSDEVRAVLMATRRAWMERHIT